MYFVVVKDFDGFWAAPDFLFPKRESSPIRRDVGSPSFDTAGEQNTLCLLGFFNSFSFVDRCAESELASINSEELYDILAIILLK